MNVRLGLDGLSQLPPGGAVTIGNFDGVHRGHASILAALDSLRASSPSGRIAVVTFEPHPLSVLRPQSAPPRLTSPAIKQELLAKHGVDDLVLLPPTPDVLATSAEAFWKILRDKARVAHIVEGAEFTFGQHRQGTMEKLAEWAADSGVKVHIAPPVMVPLLDLNVAPASSTLIRFLAALGRMRDAAICLGRPYALQGPVIQGHQRGRTIGVPTANLDCGDQLIPRDGVYAARCRIDGRDYAVALSIGTLPTLGDYARQIEGHIVGFNGDLYGRTITFELVDWLREQWKLSGLDALKTQIARDIEQIVRRVEEVDPARPIATDTMSSNVTSIFE